MSETFPTRVKKLMEQRGITQTELARRSKVSQPMISKIISGDRRGDNETMDRVAKALGTSIEYLVEPALKGKHTLRAIVNAYGACAQKFEEAEKLARSLFSKEGCVRLPYFTEHSAIHCESVEKYLNQIIWGTEKECLVLSEHDFVPTPEEAMYLLSATWLHDIGMVYGIFESEKPDDLKGDFKKKMQLRNEHEFRAIQYIYDVWKDTCSWEEDEKTWLTNICACHRQHHPINTFDPVQIISKYDGNPVRLMVLAALLRLADGCDVDQSRAPGSLMALYISLGMSQDSLNYWEKAKLIMGVDFDHTNRKITLAGRCPPEYDFDLGSFDLAEVVEIIRHDVERELRSIQQVLLPYPNTYFGEVKHKIYRPYHLKLEKEKQYLALWPYLLDKPSSSTEATASLVHILLFAIKESQETKDFGEVWQDNFLSILYEIEKLRPFDFMIRNLRRGVQDEVKELAADAKSADGLTEYLENSLNKISGNYLKIAEFALDKSLVGPKDVLVVHGYSTNNTKFMEKLAGRHEYSNSLYIVDYLEPIGKVRLGPSANERLITFANNLGFEKVGFLSLASVAQGLDELQRKKIPCKVVLATHGVLKNRDFLCSVGSYILAAMAKQFGTKVIAFAETAKFLIDGESNEEVARPEKLFSSEQMWKRHPAMINTKYLTPKMDRVPKELVDLVVTEKGIFKPEDVPTPNEQPASEMANEKKESVL